MKKTKTFNSTHCSDLFGLVYFLGASPSLSPVTSPSHSPPALGTGGSSSHVSRSPVEFPDTADFLTKPSVHLNMHKPLSYPISSADSQQAFRNSTFPVCTRWDWAPPFALDSSIRSNDVVEMVTVVILSHSCGRQMLKGVSSSDHGDSHPPFNSEGQCRRSGKKTIAMQNSLSENLHWNQLLWLKMKKKKENISEVSAALCWTLMLLQDGTQK